MAVPCPAIYFSGLSAEKHYVKVDFNPASLTIKGDLINEIWNEGDYQFERPNNKTFILENNGKQLIFTRNTIEAYFFNNVLKNHYKFFFKVSRWRPYAIGIIVFLAVGYLVSSKVSDYFLENFTLEEQRETFSFMDQSYLSASCMNKDTRRMINRILENTGHKEFTGSIYYVSSPEVNAYALPSGSIIFTKGFLKQMESVEEFIAVLFHEIGHVKHRHHLKRLRNSLGFDIVSILIFGEKTGAKSIVSKFIINKYTSSQEEESDAYARQKLDQYGISRIGAVDFFERNKENSKLAIFSTHPSSQKRINFFQADFPKEPTREYYPDMLKSLKNCE